MFKGILKDQANYRERGGMRGLRVSGVGVGGGGVTMSEEMDREGRVGQAVKMKREIWARRKCSPCHRPQGGPGSADSRPKTNREDGDGDGKLYQPTLAPRLLLPHLTQTAG